MYKYRRRFSRITHFIFFFLIAWSTAIPSLAQPRSEKVAIVWGPEEKESWKSTLDDIVGYDKSGFYALKKERKGMRDFDVILEHFNHKMVKTQSKDLNLSYQLQATIGEYKRKKYELIKKLNNQLYLFSSFSDKKTKKNTLYVQTIDKKSLEPDTQLKPLAQIDFSGKRKFNSGRYDFEFSRDSSKMLVYYSLPYEKGENQRLGLYVYDKSFNKLWDNEITLPYREDLFEVEDYQVDNEGNVHLLGVIFKDKRREKRKGEPNYNYQILSYHSSGTALTEYPIHIQNRFLTDMKIAVTKDQDIVCAGFYSEDGTFSIRGSYFLRIDRATKEIETQSFKDFGIDFITQNMRRGAEKTAKRKDEKGKNVELFRYRLDDIILRADGGAVLLGEQYYWYSVTNTTTDANGNRNTSTTYYYNYNDIIVVNISPEGKIDWTEKIAKRQVTSNDNGFYSSYALAIVGGKLYFIFNDNSKNLTYSGEGKIHNFIRNKDAIVVMVELNAKGEQDKKALFVARDADVIIRPTVCEQVSKQEVVIFGQRRKTQRFAKLRFK